MTTAFCDNVPEVAVTVSDEVPRGVPFVLAQPTISAPVRSSNAIGTTAV